MIKSLRRYTSQGHTRFMALPKITRVLTAFAFLLAIGAGGWFAIVRPHANAPVAGTDKLSPVAQAESTAPSVTDAQTVDGQATEQSTAANPAGVQNKATTPGTTTRNSSATPPVSPSPFTAGCSAAYSPPANLQPGQQWQMPAPEPKTYPGATLRVPTGQSSVSYSFATPNGLPITNIGTDHAWPGFDSKGGAPQKTLQLEAGYYNLAFYTSCVVYKVAVNVQQPELKVTSLSYQVTANEVNYALNSTVDSLSVSYEINGCDPAWGDCYGAVRLYDEAAGGTISLGYIFPELDQYFQNYTAQNVSVTLIPYKFGMETTGQKTITFVR